MAVMTMMNGQNVLDQILKESLARTIGERGAWMLYQVGILNQIVDSFNIFLFIKRL